MLMYQLVHKGICTPVCAGVAGWAQMAKLRSSTSLSCAAWLARWMPDASRMFMLLTPEAPRAQRQLKVAAQFAALSRWRTCVGTYAVLEG